MSSSTNPRAAAGAGTEQGSDYSSSDGEDDKKDKKGRLCGSPMLDKKTLLKHLLGLATASLLGVTAILVLSSNQSVSGVTEINALRSNQTGLSGVTEINALSSNQSRLNGDQTTQYIGLRQFLLSMPYTFFLFGFAAVGAAAAVQRKPHLLGCAAGILLVQLICLVVIGGVITLVRGEVNARIVWPMTAVVVFGLVLVWAVMCAYPKFLRRMLCCCGQEKKVKVGDYEDKKKDNVEHTKDQCETCGGTVVKGISPLSGEGAMLCQSCGAVASADTGV